VGPARIGSELELTPMSEEKVKEDPVKMHKQANTLSETGKYKEAEDIFAKTAELYYKVQNFFDSTSMYYKAGECAFALKDYVKAVEHFMKSAEISFQKGYDRFGVSALEYARDSCRSMDNKAKVKELEKKIKEVKEKLEASF
jgi:tetratricopeptide (TPR) repeat protein